MKLSFLPIHRSRCLLLALFALAFCLALPGSRTAAQAAPALPASVRLSGHIPAAMAGARMVGRVPSGQAMTLLLALPLRDPAGLDLLLDRLYDPADPLYGHYLTPSAFTDRFGPTQESYDAVAAFALAHGLVVNHTSPNRLLLSVSGSAAAVESAFAVHLGRYQAADGRVFRAPDTGPAIPAFLVGRLSGVIGLDNASVRHSYLRRPAGSRSALRPLVPLATRPLSLRPVFGSPGPSEIGTDPYSGYSALTPSDIKAAYSLNRTALTGAGQTLALFELDTYTPSDIAAYEAGFGLPSVPLENVPVDPSDPNFPNTPGGGASEVTLDIEIMAAIAPGTSKILVYESPNTDPGVVDQYNRIAVDNRAKVISSSWGLAELESAESTRDSENTAFKQMAAQGQSIFCASGDEGAYADYKTISVQDPASQPYMVGVGGTKLSVASPGGPYQSESAWGSVAEAGRSAFGAGGGGGISAVWPLPTYQNGIGGASASQRNVPDVSLDADPDTGYVIYFSDPTAPSQPWTVVGGTSVASPIWAAFTALANQQRAKYGEQPLGFANPTIYQIAKVAANYHVGFHDINDGTYNLYPLYATKTGYDNSTGWGSFNGAGLLPLFAPAPNTTGTAIASLALVATVAQTQNEVIGGLSVTGTVTLANPAPAAGAVVTLTTTDATTAPVPATVTVPAGATTATFTINTTVTTGTTVTITAAYQGSSLGAPLKIDAPPVAIVPTTLTLNPDSVNGGSSSLATVTLAGPAPAGGLVVTLSSSSTAAQVPASVTVLANSTTATFTVTTTPVTQQVAATLTASAGGVSVTATLTVLAPTLERLALAPPSLPGGQTSVGTLTLTFPAPASGVVVTLASDNPAATVPATVSIPAGGTTATFTITTTPVPQTVVATITATLAGLSQKAKLEVRSARITGVSVAPTSLTGGSPAVGTVTLDSPAAVAAGLVVSLAGSSTSGTVPATVTIPAGATTATFPITTVVVAAPVVDTLTATLNGISKTTALTIQPIQATNLTINPAAVIAGVATVGTVTVNAPAPPGGLVVTLTQLGAAETVPTTATVAAGQTTATFPIGTPTAGTATIAAVVGGQTRTATLTVTNAVGTSFPAGLNMVSTPYDYSGQSLDTLFGFAGVRLATWDGTVSQYAITPTAPADALRLGRGYFVKLPTAVTLTSVGTPADPTTDFPITLLPGWNMIGDPFLFPVSLSALNVSSAAGTTVPFSTAVSGSSLLVSSILYSFSPSANSGSGAYVVLQTNGSLQPGQGYWIYAYNPVTLIVPHPGQ